MKGLISAILTTAFPRTILRLEREEYEKGFEAGWTQAVEMYGPEPKSADPWESIG